MPCFDQQLLIIHDERSLISCATGATMRRSTITASGYNKTNAAIAYNDYLVLSADCASYQYESSREQLTTAMMIRNVRGSSKSVICRLTWTEGFASVSIGSNVQIESLFWCMYILNNFKLEKNHCIAHYIHPSIYQRRVDN